VQFKGHVNYKQAKAEGLVFRMYGFYGECDWTVNGRKVAQMASICDFPEVREAFNAAEEYAPEDIIYEGRQGEMKWGKKQFPVFDHPGQNLFEIDCSVDKVLKKRKDLDRSWPCGSGPTHKAPEKYFEYYFKNPEQKEDKVDSSFSKMEWEMLQSLWSGIKNTWLKLSDPAYDWALI